MTGASHSVRVNAPLTEKLLIVCVKCLPLRRTRRGQAGIKQMMVVRIVIRRFQPTDCPLVAGGLQNGGRGSKLIQST